MHHFSFYVLTYQARVQGDHPIIPLEAIKARYQILGGASGGVSSGVRGGAQHGFQPFFPVRVTGLVLKFCIERGQLSPFPHGAPMGRVITIRNQQTIMNKPALHRPVAPSMLVLGHVYDGSLVVAAIVFGGASLFMREQATLCRLCLLRDLRHVRSGVGPSRRLIARRSETMMSLLCYSWRIEWQACH